MAGFKNMTEAIRALHGDDAARAHERKCAALDWLEEQGFTEDERARVAAALGQPLYTFDCGANEEHQMDTERAGAMVRLGVMATAPMKVQFFGVFTPTRKP